MFDTLGESAAAAGIRPLDPPLTTTFMLGVGETDYRVRIVDGHVASVERGPFVMPSCDFKLSAPADEWGIAGKARL